MVLTTQRPRERARRTRRGFTLVELVLALTVVAGMLAAATATAQLRASELTSSETAHPDEAVVRETIAELIARLESAQPLGLHAGAAGTSQTGFAFRRGASSCSIVFSPTGAASEAERGIDINGDGDRADRFVLGCLSERSTTEHGTSRHDLSPAVFLLPLVDSSAEVSGAGHPHAMFAWDPDAGRLQIRLYALLGAAGGQALVRRFDTALDLPGSKTTAGAPAR